jgi:hypothetical protein
MSSDLASYSCRFTKILRWRVIELSQIILVLLDSRCPLLHFPQSLQSYLSAPHFRIILVLTKVDIVGLERASSWERYFLAHFPGVKVVMVEAYAVKTSRTGEMTTARKTKYEPFMPATFKERLVSVLKEAHEELLQPPEHIRVDPKKLKDWIPRVKRVVDWDAVLTASPHAQAHAAHPELRHNIISPENDGSSDSGDVVEPEFLTVGLIGSFVYIAPARWKLDFVQTRAAERGEIVSAQCPFRRTQGAGVQDPRKGAVGL